MTDRLLKSLGQRIAMLRKQKNISQEEFAEKSGKMINTISNIERGLTDPKISTLVALANALDVEPAYLLSEAFHKIQAPQEDIIEILKQQNTKTLKDVLKQIERLLKINN